MKQRARRRRLPTRRRRYPVYRWSQGETVVVSAFSDPESWELSPWARQAFEAMRRRHEARTDL